MDYRSPAYRVTRKRRLEETLASPLFPTQQDPRLQNYLNVQLVIAQSLLGKTRFGGETGTLNSSYLGLSIAYYGDTESARAVRPSIEQVVG